MIDIYISDDWGARAACRDAPPDLFVPGDSFDEHDPEYPSAEVCSYCDRCPVRIECDAAGTAGDLVGVWGGKTQYQRHQMRRRMSRASCPGCSSKNIALLDGIETCLACGQSWHVPAAVQTT